MNSSEVVFPVGREKITVAVPNLMAIAAPRETKGVPDERAEVRRALENPIGSKRLSELARGRKNAAIVVNDITRPYPGGLLVEEIARELSLAGLKDDDIFLVIAYGTHRLNTPEELERMFGKSVTDRFRVVHHKCLEEDTLEYIGTTTGGVRVSVNREFALADLKILTGLITPHHSAGFSGGRKSVLPGISGIETLKTHHSLPIRPATPSMGRLEGNPFHEQSLEAARMAGVDFIVNTVDNAKRELVAAVAGELDKAHRRGIDICRSIWTFELPRKADVVIVSPGGFPRDIDLYQSQKACSCAELACREGGEIILCAEASDGLGKFAAILKEAKTPREVIEKFEREGYTAESTAKAWMYARAMARFTVGLACSKVSAEDAKDMFMAPYRTIEEGISDALNRYGENASFLAIPFASDIILTQTE